MSQTLRITLKANEKIYVNGAVIRADRKVSLELLNDVHFLLENHVIQPEDASTPLKQLYFIVQVMLMNPGSGDEPKQLFRKTLSPLLETFSNPHILSTLKHVDQLVAEGSAYEALKALRGLFELEQQILNAGVVQPSPAMVAGE